MATPQENATTVRNLIQRVMNEGDIAFAEKVLLGGWLAPLRLQPPADDPRSG